MRTRVLLLTLVVACLAGPAVAFEPDVRRLITVEGQAEVRVKPDKVVVVLAAEKRAVTLVQAQAPVDAATASILALAREQRVEERDIDASDYDLQALYDVFESDSKKPLKRLGFRVRRTIVVTLRDLAAFGPFLSRVIESGLVSVTRVTPAVEETRRHRDEARLLAVRAAREKAQAIVAELGQTLGPAVTIEVDGASTPCCNAEGASPYAWRTSNAFSSNVGVMNSVGAEPVDGATHTLGVIVVTANVKVAFELR